MQILKEVTNTIFYNLCVNVISTQELGPRIHWRHVPVYCKPIIEDATGSYNKLNHNITTLKMSKLLHVEKRISVTKYFVYFLPL